VIRRVDGGSEGSVNEQFVTTPAYGRPLIPGGWSPDGKSLLASAALTKSGRVALTLWPLAAAPHAETAMKILASDPKYDLFQGTFSPDGRWVAFVAHNVAEAGASTLAVVGSAGGDSSQWTLVTDSHQWADKPRWSPDGRLLYFTRLDAAFFNLWAVRFDTNRGKPVSAAFQITHFDSPAHQLCPDIQIAEPSLARNRLILPITESTGNIWMLDNIDR
jgi:Tol biopolymer transport system component